MAREPNPYRRYKRRTGQTWAEVAETLGISHVHARKLGCGMVRQIPVSSAVEFERRTDGAMKARELLAWAMEAAA